MNYRQSIFGFVSIAAMVAAMPVMAQTANSTSGASSNSGAVSGSQSGSFSSSRGGNASNRTTSTQQQGVASTTNTGVTLNQTSNTSPNTSANNTDRITGGTSNSNTQSGYTSSDNIVRTTPTVYAPPVSGGNPCTLAVSGGVSVIGWGAAAGGTFVDQDCANRQKIAMIWNAGFKGPAKELMCNDKDSYFAFRAAGEPCQVRPQWEAQPVAGPVVQQPQPIGPQPVRTTSTQSPPFQPAGRFVCMNAMGREVPAGTPGASCGQI